ncbi:efflux RND transporter periplasmic adaptor subunit [Flavobacteriaceae bacterium]|jgi:membrane fusion protein, multidrug efflux system|nr:efflux RND transporter periplasmic adaptor subunit [Flavobacteriaceae bacterium]MDA8904467.1 efflux RND transporter periplasmic adaptor subunit [Flavobacteriaceae bacterium]MDC0622239.1 efflux RND transporter periplasmic adaptor subunit [Flavobacteriaceae bacterium]
MKKILIIVSSLIFSCQSENKSVIEVIESNNIDLIKLKREEINNKQQKIYEELNLIDLKLDELENNSKYPIVSTTKIIEQKFKHYVELQGDVKSDKVISIYPEFSGIINEIFIKSGENVGEGQILATIDDGGLKQQLSQLQITYNLAKTTYERQERLWNQKIGSEIQYLESKSMFEAQSEAIEQLNKQLSKTVIRAPFSGTVDNVIVKKGEVVYPGRSNLMLLVNMQEMYVESKVPENYINSITKGKDVVIEAPILDMILKSKISLVANYINPLNRTYRIEAEIPDNNYKIKPNLNVKIRVNDYTNENAILILLNHINIDSNNDEYVYKIIKKDGKNYASKTIIETGRNNGDFIEVLKGVSIGDEIVSEGARKITNNSEVKIINN